MKNLKRISAVSVLAAVVLLLGLALARPYNTTEAKPGNAAAAKTGRTEIAWRHAERAVKPVDSKFRINLPSISPGAEWLVGVKPVKAGEKEKMYVGVFTWEDDKNKGANGRGFKQLSRMQDYPQELSSFVDGAATLSGSINPDETLVIYMEVAPSTRTIFSGNGKEKSFDASGGSYLVFDGKFERTPIEHTGSLIARANGKKLKKELAKSGLASKDEKPAGYGIGSAAYGYAAGATAPAQNCVTESVNESCVGGECTCWSVTTTCGGASCSSSGGGCRESGGVSISWSIPTVCNF